MRPEERRVYDLIVRRFLGTFYPAARYSDVTVSTRVETPEGPAPSQRFLSRGRSLLDAGWRVVAGFDDQKRRKRGPGVEDETSEEAEPDAGAELLARLRQGDAVQVAQAGVEEKQTRPPPRYTDALVLAAMEGAGNAIDDETLRRAMKDSGLGTPATRAQILETLLERGYLERDAKTLRVTASGKYLLQMLSVDELKSAEMTGRWEARLARMARGEEPRERFLQDIRTFVVELTRRLLATTPPPPVEEVVGTCPRCRKEVLRGRRFYECRGAREGECSTRIPRMVAGKTLTEHAVAQLLKEGRTRVLKGFRSKAGKSFAAALALDAKGGVEFRFDPAPAAVAPATRRDGGAGGPSPSRRKSALARPAAAGGPTRRTGGERPPSPMRQPSVPPSLASGGRTHRRPSGARGRQTSRGTYESPIWAADGVPPRHSSDTQGTRPSRQTRESVPPREPSPKAGTGFPAKTRVSTALREPAAWRGTTAVEGLETAHQPALSSQSAAAKSSPSPGRGVARGRPEASARASAADSHPVTKPSLEALGPACPLCGKGQVITGRRGWGCARWKEGCPFVILVHGQRQAPDSGDGADVDRKRPHAPDGGIPGRSGTPGAGTSGHEARCERQCPGPRARERVTKVLMAVGVHRSGGLPHRNRCGELSDASQQSFVCSSPHRHRPHPLDAAPEPSRQGNPGPPRTSAPRMLGRGANPATAHGRAAVEPTRPCTERFRGAPGPTTRFAI